MRKIFLFMLLGMFVISFASASMFQSNLIFNHNKLTIHQKTFLKDNIFHHRKKLLRNYGTYEVHKNKWLGLLRGDTTQTYTLLSSDNSIINAYAILDVHNYQSEKLLTKMSFTGGTPRDLKLSYWVNESYFQNRPIYKKVCLKKKMFSTNETIQNNCKQIKVRTEKIKKYKAYWKPYKNQILPIGEYKLKITAKLPRANHKVDWVLHTGSQDIALTDWLWWNNSWGYKKEIKVQENSGTTLTNYSILLHILYNSNMNTNFSDLRFTNSAENTELGYWIENYTASTDAYIWIKVPTLTASINTSIYMYYGNSVATTTSNFNNAFLFADDFSTNTSADYTDYEWDSSASVPFSVSGGILSVSANAYHTTVLKNSYSTTLSTTNGFEISADMLSTGTNWGRLGIILGTDYISGSQDVGYGHIQTDGGSITYLDKKVAGTYSTISTDTSLTFSTNTWYNVKLRVSNQNWEVLVNDAVKGSGAITNSSIYGTINPALIFRPSTSGYTMQADNFILKNYVPQEPTYTIGAEQTPIVPTILNLPYNNTFLNYSDVLFNWTSYDIDLSNSTGDLTSTTLYIWYSNKSLYKSTWIPLPSLPNVTTTRTETLSDGNYIWNAETCGVGVNCSFAVSNRTIFIDATPPTINVSYAPNGIIDYMYPNYNLTLNFTASDSHLDSCWYQYNNSNVSVPCTNATLNNVPFNYQKDNNALIVYANDTYGNLASKTEIWNYKVYKINQTYSNTTIEGSIENFQALIKVNPDYSISQIYFYYNETQNSALAFTQDNHTILIKNDMLIPPISNNTNLTFYWDIILDDGTNIKLTPRNQTVLNLDVDNCTNYNNKIYNFTIVDEDTQNKLTTSSEEIAINIFDRTKEHNVLSYSKEFTNVNPITICLNRNISTEYYVNAIIKYSNTNHAIEHYNIENQLLDNSTPIQSIFLYDLNSSLSTDFKFIFTGSDYLPVANALVYLERQYIKENVFKTVEVPKTDSNGETVLHIIRNNMVYNIKVVKDGEVIGNFKNIIAFCDDYTVGNCVIALSQSQVAQSVFNFNDLGIKYSGLKYNSTTGKISINYITTDSSTKTINLVVTKNDIFGNDTVCNSSLTSAGGTITCDVGTNLEESELKAYVYVDGILTVHSNIVISKSDYGQGGYLVLFIMAISLIFMFSGSKTGVLIAIGVTTAGAIGLGMITGTMIGNNNGASAMGVWLLVILIMGIWKLNYGRVQ
ncbi:MAG TPA: DUF2341 domain-containing protein [Thioploca sp.]|nr:DUF2341 domain-containing protein [Thioploca sp.]